MDARKERIASELQKIEEVKRDLSLLKSDYESKLSRIEEQARIKVQEALSEGKRITEEIRKDAYRNAQDIIEQSRANVKYELVKAKQELKEKIVDLVLTATESVIQDKLDEEDDKKLVREFLARIDSAE
jgi:F-type H+-transporting ATPase subunit b